MLGQKYFSGAFETKCSVKSAFQVLLRRNVSVKSAFKVLLRRNVQSKVLLKCF